MWKSPDQLLEGHLDCSSGVSEDALFAACVDAATANDDSAARTLVDRVEDVVKKVIGLPDSQVPLDIARDSRVGSLKIYIPSGHALSRSINGDPQEFSLEQVKLLLSGNSPGLTPDWVKDRCLEVISELVEAEAKVRGLDYGDIMVQPTSVFFAVGIMLCLYSMGVRRVSCTPIPIGHLGSVARESVESDENRAVVRVLLL
jgi:uncharacterized protein (DUF111 family)